MCIY
jgi:hypothetical protein